MKPQSHNLFELQKKWYEILKKDGFDDIEGCEEFLTTPSGTSQHVELNGRLVDLIDLHYAQAPLEEMSTSFQEPLMSEIEKLLHHPKLNQVCFNICRHGNHTLEPHDIKEILELHIEGQTERFIGQELNINDTLIHRTINTLINWSKVMSNEEILPDSATVKIRAFNHEIDTPFIYSTWRNNLWFDKERPPEKADQFYRAANKRIKLLLSKPSILIRMACLEEDPTFIVGYAVLDNTNLEWAYIKIGYRKNGIAKALAKGFKTVSLPLTQIGEQIVKKKKFKIQGERIEDQPPKE